MEDALELCGLNAQTIRYLVTQGFTTPNDLLLATESELNSMAMSVARNPPRNIPQVNMPFMALKNLKGLCFWADERKRTGFEADAADITARSRQSVRSIANSKMLRRTKMHRSRRL
jgi:hypothetical protein